MNSEGKSSKDRGGSDAALDPIVQYFMKDRGRAYQLAIALNIKPQAVYQWKRTPIERVRDVERITGISRHILRPDIYGEQ